MSLVANGTVGGYLSQTNVKVLGAVIEINIPYGDTEHHLRGHYTIISRITFVSPGDRRSNVCPLNHYDKFVHKHDPKRHDQHNRNAGSCVALEVVISFVPERNVSRENIALLYV